MLRIPVIKPDGRGTTGDTEMDLVEGLVKDYTKVHPKEMKYFAMVAKGKREMLKDKRYGTTGHENNMRHGACLPVGLVVLIKKYFPDFFDNPKNVKKFLARFPGFRISERT